MKSIILYVSKTGCTEKCAEYINKNNDQAEISQFIKFRGELSEYDNIVIMSPTRMGKLHKDFKTFVTKNKQTLLTKNLFLVVIGMNITAIDSMMSQNVDKEILEHSKVIYGGGAYYLDRMSFMDKYVVKTVAKVTQSSESIKYDNLDKIKI